MTNYNVDSQRIELFVVATNLSVEMFPFSVPRAHPSYWHYISEEFIKDNTKKFNKKASYRSCFESDRRNWSNWVKETAKARMLLREDVNSKVKAYEIGNKSYEETSGDFSFWLKEMFKEKYKRHMAIAAHNQSENKRHESGNSLLCHKCC